jgi:hypothetical protein
VAGFTIAYDTAKHGAITAVAVEVGFDKEDVDMNLDAAGAGAPGGPGGGQDGQQEGLKLDLRARVLLTTSTGAIQMWAHDAAPWTREESLASTSAVALVDLPEAALVSTTGSAPEDNSATAAIGSEGFAHRLQRHLFQTQNLPAYIRGFVDRFTAPASPTSLASAYNISTTALVRDSFGIRKLVVLATPHGTVFALDSASGQIIWQKLLSPGYVPLAESEATGGAEDYTQGDKKGQMAKVFATKLFELRSAADNANVALGLDKAGESDSSASNKDYRKSSKTTPTRGAELVLVALRRAQSGQIDSLVYHFDALTGRTLLPRLGSNVDVLKDAGVKDAEGEDNEEHEEGGALEGLEVAPVGLVESYVVDLSRGAEGAGKTVVMIDEYQQVRGDIYVLV